MKMLFPRKRIRKRKINTFIIAFVLVFSFTSINILQSNEELLIAPRKNCQIQAINILDPIELTPNHYFYGLIGPFRGRTVTDVFVVGDFAYLALIDGISIVNISDPLDPTEVGHLGFGYWIEQISVQGNRAYLLSYIYLWIIDITDVTNPIMLAEYQDANPPYYHYFFVKGNYTYIVDYYYGLIIYKTDIPSSITKVGQLAMGDWYGNIFVQSNTAFICDYDGLELVYVYNPASPTHTTIYSGTNFIDVRAVGSLVFVTNDDGLVIYDKSNLLNPVIRGVYPQSRLSNLYVNDTMIYVTTYDSFTVVGVDISDPDNPKGIGNYNTGYDGNGQLFISGELIFCTADINGLLIIGSDADNDKLTDYQEKIIGTNTTNPDTDGDEMSDYYEYTSGLNPLDPTDADEDLDGDGLTNIDEHNRGTNPNNEDTDSDDLTDWDEIFIYLTDPRISDTDIDGLSDSDELFIHETDPLDDDTDDDLLSDGDEFLIHNTDPLDEDTDGDTLLDGAEVNEYNTNPLAADTDADGYTDAEEIAAGTDPLDPNDQPFDATPIYIVVGFLVVLALTLILAFFYRKKTPAKSSEEKSTDEE